MYIYYIDYMEVPEIGITPKSSISRWYVPIINHSIGGTPILGNTHIDDDVSVAK